MPITKQASSYIVYNFITYYLKTMSQEQANKTLYIDKFKEQVELLLNPYEHPKYLELLGPKEDLQKKYKSELVQIINDTFVKQKKEKNNPDKKYLKKRFEKIIKEVFESSSETLESIQTIEDSLKNKFECFLAPDLIEKKYHRFVENLKEKLIKSLDKHKKSITSNIQARIRREPVISQEDAIKGEQDLAQIQHPPTSSVQNDHIYTKLDDIIGELWTSFSKSLLEGEFLKDSDYYIKLQAIITEIKHTYDTSSQEETIYLHPILPFIHELCQELSYMCLRIRVQIEESQEEASCKRKVFHAPVSDLARKLYAGGMNSEEMLKAKFFHDLGKKLIEMTRIDISGIIDDQAIPPLLLLYKQSERLKAENDAMCRDFPTDLDIKAIFKAICAKTSLLLFQSFYKPVVSPNNSRELDIDKSIKNPYTRAKNFEILYEGNIYYVQKENVKEDNLLHSKIKEFKSLIPFEKPSTDNSTVKPKDIKNYDDYVTEENKKEKWKDLLQKEERQKEILESLLKDPKNINEDDIIYFRSLDSLLALMKRLKEMKEESQKKEEGKNNYDTSKYAQVLGHLLKYFSEWIQSYKDFVSAEQKRNKFEYSFYMVKREEKEEKEEREEKEQPIFISCFGCKLIHTPALQDEAYPKYNRLYRQWISEAQDEALDKANEAKCLVAKVDKKAQEVDNKTKKLSKDSSRITEKISIYEKTIERTKKGIETKISNLQISTRKESISILSIFVALLSFISGGINILKGADSLADYLILTSTLYFFIAAMIFFLYFKAIEGDNPKKKFNWAKIVLAVSMGIAVILIFHGLHKKDNNKTEVQDSKGSLEMNVKVENFKQASPNVKQITNSSSDSSKTSDVIKGDQGKKKTENASKEQQKKQGKS